MAIDLLSLIGTVYRDRLGREELAQRGYQSAAELASRERESAADRALRESMQGREFDFQGKESAAERALREKLEAERLGLTRTANEMNQLSQLSQLLGQGASNIPQADVLSLLAQRFGVPVNTAQLRNASRASSVQPRSSGYGESGVTNAVRPLGLGLGPGLEFENRGGTWMPKRFGFPT